MDSSLPKNAASIRFATAAIAAMIALFALAAPAGAAIVTVGQKDLSVQSGTDDCDGPMCSWTNYYNVALADPSVYLNVPADGTVSAWRVRGVEAGSGRFRMHALQSLGGLKYVGVGDTSAAAYVNGAGINVASMPVHAGDTLSVSAESFNVAGAKADMAYVNSSGASCSSIGILNSGNTADASNFPGTGCAYLFNADIDLTAPRIDGIDVASGPIAGGTNVTITGDHLAVASSVKFGGTPALVTAASNTKVTVVAPAAPSGGAVDLSVVTAGGVATTRFTYDDLKAPSISKFTMSRTKFGVANLGGPVLAKVGSTVRFKLSEAAAVTFSVSRVDKKGRLKALPKKRRWVVAGTLGTNRFTFTGRPGKKPLSVGKYVLLGSAIDVVGTKGKTVRVSFRIVK
jgi:hypothetical protein